jgi:peptidyl-prolyl cis-trans isomerase C
VPILAVLGGGILVAQAPPPRETAPKADSSGKIVAVIEGKGYTAEEIEWIRKNTPPEFVKQTEHMTYGGFLEALAMQIAVANRAQELKLADKEPYRTRLEINTRIFLTNAYLAEIQQVLKLTQDDYRKFYEQHQEDYQDVRLSAIYIDYSLDPDKAKPKDGKKALNETEAWAKAEQLAAELRQGADFAELARQNSDDPDAAEKGGDMGYFKRDSRTMPQALKTPIFTLKEGQISEPIKHGGRYYIFKVTERRLLAYTEALPDILKRIQDVKIKEQLDRIRAEMQLDIKDEAFAASRPSPAASGEAAPSPQNSGSTPLPQD